MTDYQPFLNRLRDVVAELDLDYDYEDAEREAEEIGVDPTNATSWPLRIA